MELEHLLSDSDFFDPTATSSDDDDIYYPASESLMIQDLLKDLKKELVRALEISQQQTKPELQSLKRDIEESYDKSRKAKIGGTVATVTGSTLGILGFGLAFVTFGASLPLLIIGGAMGVAGGVTAVGADIGYTVVWKKHMKKVEEVCQREEERIQRVRNLTECIQENLEELRRRFPQYTQEQILGMILDILQGDSNTKIFSASHVIHFGHAAVALGDTARIGTQIATRTVLRTLVIAGRAVGGVGAALDAILLPVDIFVMVKASMDVHKYKGGRGESNSDAAREVGKIIRKHEERIEKMKTLRDNLPMIENSE